jgi:hypothetical protein
MSPILQNHYSEKRANYSDRRKNRFDRRQEANWMQKLFQFLSKKAALIERLAFKRKRSSTERRRNGERRRSWVRYFKWCSIYAPSLEQQYIRIAANKEKNHLSISYWK